MLPETKKQMSSYTQEFDCLNRMLSASLLVNDIEGFQKALQLLEDKVANCKAHLQSDLKLQMAS